MKTVLPKSDIAHLWANQSQIEARTANGSFSFFNAKLYSYSAVIGRLFDDVAVFTTQSYSVTTSSQQGLAQSAASHLKQIHCKYIPDNAKDKEAHVKNINAYISDIREIAEHKLLNARKPEIHILKIEQIKNSLQEYCDFFKVNLTKTQQKQITITSKEDAQALLSKAIKAKKDKAAKKERLIKKHFPILLDNWRKHNEKEYHKGLTPNIKQALETCLYGQLAYLRITQDGEKIETSKHIKISIREAKAAYLWYKKQVDKGGCTDCNYSISHYSINAVNAAKIVAGCHTIPFSEIEYIANKLNW